MTEKNYNPEQKAAKSMRSQEKAAKQNTAEAPAKTEKKDEETKQAVKAEEKAKKDKKPEKPRKTEAVVNAKSLPISTLDAIAICRFIKGKKIGVAVKELEEVSKLKRAVPMKGELPHRKGKIMSGRYPQKAAEQFIKLLKSLQANALVNELNEPKVTEAVSNKAYQPYGRFGRVRRKRTHVKLRTVSGELNK
jgi:large subunit ribosomal protein L22